MIPLAAAIACAAEPEVREPPPPIAVPNEAVLASFGSLYAPAEDASVLSRVIDAALSSSGRYLAIADEAAPFVRLVDLETDQVHAFGRLGDGPGELRAAHAVELVDDSLVYVFGGGQRLDRFGLDGVWLGGDRLGDARLLLSSITVACGGQVFLYGVPPDHRRLDPVPWVHELARDGETTSRLSIRGSGYAFSFGGALHGFDGDETGVVLWHRALEPQVGYWIPCDGGEPTIWDHTAAERTDVDAVVREDGARGMSFTLPDTLFAGAAARGPLRIRAFRPSRPGEIGDHVTTLRVTGPEDCRVVRLGGRWSLHDAHRQGLVLSTSDPFPSVVFIDWAWLESKLSLADCAP